MNENNRIRIAMIAKNLEINGISTVVSNYCKALDKNKYDLTILAGQSIAPKHAKECKEYGIHLISLPSRHGESLKHYSALWKALKAEHYDIVHVHGSSSMMAIELTIARLAGVKVRIAHSHNSTCPNYKVHKLLNPYFRKIYSKALACGKLAGDWLFGENNFEILPNGFHTENFTFSNEDRAAIRNELGVDDQLLIGHIGRVNEQKNQEYLLEIFEKSAAVRKDAMLLIVGTGPDEEKIKAKIQKHPYKDRIIFYGETDNPTAFYSAMDVFVFPSRYEGLPVVLLEAQISGLPCVVSDRVTKEVDLGNINWQSIDGDPQLWADAILAVKIRTAEERLAYKEEHIEEIQKYDITQTVKQLEKIYSDLMEK